ncbi:hypothetical protein DY000_02041656 [Brassica cretica]|uniref:Uncharacterized protein n=1 Tax=Brassica cretica TaxID=69181 RepID=A0ABQ7BBF0_BRACR|nr:hypothetical protein DY000_02041656 [Brassica cretica]
MRSRVLLEPRFKGLCLLTALSTGSGQLTYRGMSQRSVIESQQNVIESFSHPVKVLSFFPPLAYVVPLISGSLDLEFDSLERAGFSGGGFLACLVSTLSPKGALREPSPFTLEECEVVDSEPTVAERVSSGGYEGDGCVYGAGWFENLRESVVICGWVYLFLQNRLQTKVEEAVLGKRLRYLRYKSQEI